MILRGNMVYFFGLTRDNGYFTKDNGDFTRDNGDSI